MIVFLRDFFFNAGVFKGTVRAALIGGGVAIAALPASVLGDAPSWVRIGGAVLVAVGAFIRAGEPNPKDDAEDEDDGSAGIPPGP